ncbi:hypothetical protein GGR92_000002 [Spirosoma lacussanchae]|uniref:hypothetical protein n=1 Tax=Spirosoma lacussanchae TaxID=1884249 RepID=UPI0011096F8A|nr:hypothetical protein [Spirosoma lacussanchae]
MRTLLYLLTVLLCASSLLAQSNQPAPISGSVYPGTPFSFSTTITNQGAPVSLSISVTDRPGGKPVKSENQPTLTQVGNTVFGSWTAAQTLRLYQNRSVWVALFANGTAIRAGLYEFSYSSRPTRPGEVVNLQLYGGVMPDALAPLSTSIAANTDAINNRVTVTAYNNFTATQATTNQNLVISLAGKAPAADVYTKAQIDAKKVDTYEVNTISDAIALTVPGKTADFIVKSHPPYGQTRAYWNGSKFFISPLLEITVP